MPTKKKQRNSYSEEFKRRAVEPRHQPDVKVNEVADQLEISPQYPSKWRSDASRLTRQGDIESELSAAAEKKILREELRKARMDIEILKKAASYSANQG